MKPVSDTEKKADTPDDRRERRKAYCKAYREANKEHRKAWCDANKARIRKAARERREFLRQEQQSE